MTGVNAALKQVQINDESELDDYSVEIDVLMQYKHHNVVELYEAYFFNKKLMVCCRCIDSLVRSRKVMQLSVKNKLLQI